MLLNGIRCCIQEGEAYSIVKPLVSGFGVAPLCYTHTCHASAFPPFSISSWVNPVQMVSCRVSSRNAIVKYEDGGKMQDLGMAGSKAFEATVTI